MTPKLTLINTGGTDKENPLVPVVKAEMYKNLAPVLGLKKERLEKAYEKCTASLKEAPLLERLTMHVGNEALAWLPDIASFPAKDKVRQTFFEDDEKDEYPFDDFNDDDDEEGEPNVDNDIEAVIVAKEKVRFPKMVIFFWHLARKQGPESAHALLCQTLYALAVYQLLSTGALSKRMVWEDPLVQALHPRFQDILKGFHWEPKKSASEELNTVRTGVANQVSEAVETQEGVAVLQTRGNTRSRSHKVLAGQKEEGKELQYFAISLARAENFERLAAKILAACPPSKTKK